MSILNSEQRDNLLKETSKSDKAEITILSFPKKNLTSIGQTAFQGLVNLVRLDLSSNQIAKIEKNSFKDNVNLVHLDLRSNQLKSIDSNTFKGICSFILLILYYKNCRFIIKFVEFISSLEYKY